MAAEGWQDEEFCGSMDLDLKSARINCDKLNRFMDFEIVPIALGLDWPEIHTLDLKLTSQIGFSSVLDDMESIPIISKKKVFTEFVIKISLKVCRVSSFSFPDILTGRRDIELWT